MDLLYEWRRPEYLLWLVRAENGLSLLLVSTIPLLTWHLSGRRQRWRYLSETAKWCVLGFFFTLGVSILAALIQSAKGEMSPMVYLITTLGVFASSLIGHRTGRFAARHGSRQRGRRHHRARRRESREAEGKEDDFRELISPKRYVFCAVNVRSQPAR